MEINNFLWSIRDASFTVSVSKITGTKINSNDENHGNVYDTLVSKTSSHVSLTDTLFSLY